MTSTDAVMLRILSLSVSVANRAGKIIRNIWKTGDLSIVEKEPKDLQTEADRAAQKCIVSSLLKKFPRLTVIGEEGEDCKDLSGIKDDWIENNDADENVMQMALPEHLLNLKEEDIVVWVDPLDGTSEFTEGLLDHVTVLIGLAVGGRPVAGVIHQPYYNYQAGAGAVLGRTIWGIDGCGNFGFTLQEPPKGKLFITTTRSHSNQMVNDCIDSLKPDEIIRVGGAGHKVLLLIEGKAHGYVFPSAGCKKWDTCAPEAILRSLGGELTDMHGNLLQYEAGVKFLNSAGVLASTQNHEWFVKHIPQYVKDKLRP